MFFLHDVCLTASWDYTGAPGGHLGSFYEFPRCVEENLEKYRNFLEISRNLLDKSKKIIAPEAPRNSPKLPPKPRKLPEA